MTFGEAPHAYRVSVRTCNLDASRFRWTASTETHGHTHAHFSTLSYPTFVEAAHAGGLVAQDLTNQLVRAIGGVRRSA